ncbi:hydrophobic tubular protein NS1 [Changuinola virus]|uniref:Non-structural protein NS1 n=1 Tax=Changuinola virus TaxID=40052 RepID=U5NTQ0_9REOV|nr:hydrophobic tubular protein NS1 [Changuinola virus]AGY34646.1 hydrophobic tubular protein NS1 [Changuinola virus]
MERFLTRFQISGERAISVKTFFLVSDDWTCSHVRRDCFFKGKCARQFFKDCVEQCANEGTVAEARELVEIATRAVCDREKLWLNLYRSLQYDDENVSEMSLNGVMGRARQLYQESGMLDDVKTMKLTANPDRVTLDDCSSCIHMTFLPIYHGRICKPMSIMRYGQFGIIFINKERIESLVPFDQEEFRHEKIELQNHVRQMLPICPTTGSRSRIYNLAFAPMEMAVHMRHKEFKLEICKRLEMDFKYVNQLGTRYAPRMILQRTSLEVRGEDPGLTPYMARLQRNGSDDSFVKVRMCVTGNEDWRTWLYPELLGRMFNQGRIDGRLIHNYIEGRGDCQMCFLQNLGLGREVIMVDTRTAEIVGTNPVRTVMNSVHDNNDVKLACHVLTGNQILTKMCNHWVITTASSAMEAFVITATTIHRDVRGKGLWMDKRWQEAVYQMGRLMFRFDLNARGRTNILRLFCFVCFGYMPVENGKMPDWTDLGSFLRMVMGGEINSMGKDFESFTVLLEAVRGVMVLSNKHEIVPAALEERPDNMHMREQGFAVESHMHNEYVRRGQH